MAGPPKQKLLVVGAGPVGALAALYAASRGDEVEVYELRGGTFHLDVSLTPLNIPEGILANTKGKQKTRRRLDKTCASGAMSSTAK